MTNRFSPSADPYSIPEEHEAAYQEMCQQFIQGVVRLYQDAMRTTIMRELPYSLQMNALTSGAFIGALVPIMMQSNATDDEGLARALQASFPMIVHHARKLTEDNRR